MYSMPKLTHFCLPCYTGGGVFGLFVLASEFRYRYLISSFGSISGSFTILEGPLMPPPPEEPVRNHLRRTSSSHTPKTSDKVKNKIKNFWHKVQYGWRVKSESNFAKKKPIFLLR